MLWTDAEVGKELALETSANFVATRAGNSLWISAGFQREFPASVSWA